MNKFSLAEQAASLQLAAYNARDIESFLQCYSDDIELLDLKTGEIFCSGHTEMQPSLPFLHQEEKQLMKIESNFNSSRIEGRHYMTTFFLFFSNEPCFND